MNNWHSPALSAAYEVIATTLMVTTDTDARADLVEALSAIELADDRVAAVLAKAGAVAGDAEKVAA